jgi:hypothetical protein
MKKTLLTLIVIILVFSPSCKYFKGKKLFGKKADTMAVWHARQDSLRVADSLKAVTERLQAVENARLDSIRAAEEKLVWEKKFKFNIIVGSFLIPENAKGLAAEYAKKGYQTRIIKMEGGQFNLVCAESLETYHGALSRLKFYQGNEEVDSWIYEKR